MCCKTSTGERMRQITITLIVGYMTLLMGCSHTIPQKSAMELGEHHHMQNIKARIKVDDGPRIWYEGFASIPAGKEYEYYLYHKGDMDYLQWETCSVFEVVEDEDHRYKFDYKPGKIDLEERVNFCAMKIKALERENSRYGLGTFDVCDPAYNMDADVRCGLHEAREHGCYSCQNRFQKLIEIEFGELVLSSTKDSGCPQLGDGQSFRFNMPLGHCTYSFIGKNSGKEFKFNTFGHDRYILLEQ